jgi:hypothetical protein
VNDFHVSPLLLQVLGHQAAVAFVGFSFRAKQAGTIDEFPGKVLDASLNHQLLEPRFIGAKAFVLSSLLQHFLGRSEICTVFVVEVIELMQKET